MKQKISWSNPKLVWRHHVGRKALQRGEIRRSIKSEFSLTGDFVNNAYSLSLPSLCLRRCSRKEGESVTDCERERERGRVLWKPRGGKVGCSTFNLQAVSVFPGLSEEWERQCTAVRYWGVSPQGKSPLHFAISQFIYLHTHLNKYLFIFAFIRSGFILHQPKKKEEKKKSLALLRCLITHLFYSH